jgi:transposase InsO family protein
MCTRCAPECPRIQFTSWAFTSKARNAGLPPSLGTVRDPYDNAVVESFWRRMQVELLNRRRWRTRVELANAASASVSPGVTYPPGKSQYPDLT